MRAAAEAVEEVGDPAGKIADVGEEIGAKTGERDLWRHQDEHCAQEQQIHQVDHNEREKCAVLSQVALVFRNHPAGEREMKRPGRADHGIEESPVRLQVEEKAETAVYADGENAVNREKIRGQADQEVVAARDDVSAAAADPEPADAPAH